MLGDAQLDSRGRRLWPPSPEALSAPTPVTLMTLIQQLRRPPSLGSCPSAAAATRAFSRGAPGLLLHEGVDSVICLRGQRAGTGCRTGFYAPSARGCSPTGPPQILYNPKRPLHVRAVYVCTRASVNSSRNMHFGTRCVTSHTSLASRPCFNLTWQPCPPRKVGVEAQIPPVLRAPCILLL